MFQFVLICSKAELTKNWNKLERTGTQLERSSCVPVRSNLFQFVPSLFPPSLSMQNGASQAAGGDMCGPPPGRSRRAQQTGRQDHRVRPATSGAQQPPAASVEMADGLGERKRTGSVGGGMADGLGEDDGPRGALKRPPSDQAFSDTILKGLLVPLCSLVGVEQVTDAASFPSAAAATLGRCADVLHKRARHDSPPPPVRGKASLGSALPPPERDPIAHACELAIADGAYLGGRSSGVMSDPIGLLCCTNQESLMMGDACWANEKGCHAGVFVVVQSLKPPRGGVIVERVGGRWCWREADLARLGCKITYQGKAVTVQELFRAWHAPPGVEVVIVDRKAADIYISQVDHPCTLRFGPCAETTAVTERTYCYFAALTVRGNHVSVHDAEPSPEELLEHASSRLRNSMYLRQMCGDLVHQQVSLRDTHSGSIAWLGCPGTDLVQAVCEVTGTVSLTVSPHGRFQTHSLPWFHTRAC